MLIEGRSSVNQGVNGVSIEYRSRVDQGYQSTLDGGCLKQRVQHSFGGMWDESKNEVRWGMTEILIAGCGMKIGWRDQDRLHFVDRIGDRTSIGEIII